MNLNKERVYKSTKTWVESSGGQARTWDMKESKGRSRVKMELEDESPCGGVRK